MNKMTKRLIDVLVPVLWWLFSLTIFLWLTFVVLPHKSFDFTDHGFYLYDTMMLARGFIPGSGYAAIINAGVFKLGVQRYLVFEQIYYLLTATAIIYFWSGFRSIAKSYLLPLAIIISLAKNFTYILSYQTAPAIFLLLGLGVLFRAIDAATKTRQIIFYIVAGVILALTALSNVALFPTLVTSWGLIWWLLLRRQPNTYYFYLPYWLTGTLVTVFYLSSANSLFKHPPVYFSFGTLLQKIPLFFVDIFSHGWLSLSVLGVLTLLFAIKKTKKLTEKRVSIFVGVVFLFLLTSWYTQRYLQFFLQNQLFISAPIAEYNLIYYGVMTFYFFLFSLVILTPFCNNSLRYFIVALISISYTLGLVVGTASDLASHLSLSAPLFIALAFLRFEESCEHLSQVKIKFFFILLMGLFAVMGVIFHLHYSYRAEPPQGNKIKIYSGSLRGVYTDQGKLNILQTMVKLYKENNCNEKYFLAYPIMPLLYYVFAREAYLNRVWINDKNTRNNISSADFEKLFQPKQNWCVFEALNFNSDQQSFFADFHRFLGLKSNKVIHFVSETKPSIMAGKSSFPQEFYFYVKY